MKNIGQNKKTPKKRQDPWPPTQKRAQKKNKKVRKQKEILQNESYQFI